MASAKNIGGWVYRLCFKKIHTITSTYSIGKAFNERLPMFNDKLLLFFWGLDFDILNKKASLTEFTKTFLNSIKESDIFIFYPRSIIRITRFDLLIEAMNIIKYDLPKNTRIIIWHGNVTDSEYEHELKAKVNSYGLDTYIRFIKHPYLPDRDIYEIWKRTDFSINIIESDGLSSQFMEALIFEKPILLSGISTYTPFNDSYNLKLDFVENNVNDVVKGLKYMFSCYGEYNREILTKRREFALKHFNFEENVNILLRRLQ
ncbi:glycosyltransferase [Saccharicrinis sp. FJH54]|uniref:glycosyltransferase n=1 Tax=Saccharicrinis sp. FJH54 TaxID=3344665 RepID=UPI0035D446EF